MNKMTTKEKNKIACWVDVGRKASSFWHVVQATFSDVNTTHLTTLHVTQVLLATGHFTYGVLVYSQTCWWGECFGIWDLDPAGKHN